MSTRHYIDGSEYPELKPGEEIVAFRTRGPDYFIVVYPGEIVISDTGARYPYEHSCIQSKNGHYTARNGGKGRWIVRKTGVTAVNKYNPTKELPVMAEQKPLTYKTDTLIKALKAELKRREEERADAKKKLEEKNAATLDQLIELLKEYPTFLRDVVHQVTYRLVAGEAGTDTWKSKVEEHYASADKPEEEQQYDEDLKKLVRVYEKAEDDTVEVHVHDTVYNYL